MSCDAFSAPAVGIHRLRRIRRKVLHGALAVGMGAMLVCPPAQSMSQLDDVTIGEPCRAGEGALAQARNIYNGRAGAAGSVVVCGAAEPMLDKRPIVWWEKHTRAERISNEHFDNGVAYMQLRKDGGDASAVSSTASIIQTGGTGDAIAVHGRAIGYNPESKTFAGWFYADAPRPFQQMTGIEINLRNNGTASPWVARGFPKATAVGLSVSMADYSAFPGTHAIYIAAQTGARGWRTGVFMPENAIEPTDAAGNGEAMRFNGGRTISDAYKLIRTSGQFVSGIETTEGSFSRGILEMAEGQYLAWSGSSDRTGDNKLSVGRGNMLAFSGAGLQLRPVSAPPRDPEEGAIVFADGTGWNPGEGRGFYGFERGAWRKL